VRPKIKLTGQQVARVGEHLVAAEIHLRGGYATTFAGNMPGVDLLASDAGRRRTVHVRVKTRTSGSWHHAVALPVALPNLA
jgi:Holliday junction resolvase-like predicted endonuclease